MTQGGAVETGAPAAGDWHRVPLGETTWSMWRDVCLRSAGFPADMVLAICDEALARSADQRSADQTSADQRSADQTSADQRSAGRGSADGGSADGGEPAYDVAYPDATRRLSLAIAGTYADDAFREALTWQNPVLAQLLLDVGVGGPRRSQERQRELTIASYLQRYCLKNDTISFFGPVGWACADPGTAGMVVTPGRQLIARRTTYFEVWAIDKVAAALAAQGRVAGWLRPRRSRSVYLDGHVLHRPYRKPVTLTDTELAVLLACDGSRTIGDVSAGGPDARTALTRLTELGALRQDLDGPAHAWPERLLRDKLELIADPVARAAALEPVDQLIRARDEVTATAGDPAGLQLALTELAETFEKITGSAATRRAGADYAGRTLVYQDAVRDVHVELGEAVTGALAAPLGLVLDSAHWLVGEITDRYRVLFAELFDEEIARAGGGPVPFLRLMTLASPYLSRPGIRGVGEFAAESVAELQRRWRQVLGPHASAGRHQVSVDAISARVAECFPRRPAPWSGARQYSPDIMIAAASPAEVERGNFLLVLGEIHLAINTLDQRLFVEQHPDPARLIAAERADLGQHWIVPIQERDHPDVTSRTSPPSALLGPGQVYWSSALAGSLEPPDSDTVLPGAAMTVVRRGDDLVVQVSPSGAELDFFEVVGDAMSAVVIDGLQLVAPAVHLPRITIDKLVLSREKWAFQVADSAWAFAKDEQERYYLARRWRQDHQLPERVFYRVPVELKPTAADFSSIVLINLFAKNIRRTQAAGHSEYSVTEMLPDLDQLWLTDRAGQCYSSELRLIVHDGGTEEPSPGDAQSERCPA